MSQLRSYLSRLRKSASDPEAYSEELEEMAEALGASKKALLVYASRNSMGVKRALQVELYTDGAVPAASLNSDAEAVLELAERIIGRRIIRRLQAAGERV